MTLTGFSGKSLARLLDATATGRLIAVIRILLILLLAHGLARLTWQVQTPAGKDAWPEARPSPASNEQRPDAASLATRIADWHLFGRAETRAAQDTPEPTAAPRTRLQLTLYGVLASDDPNQAYAIIAGSDKQARVYGVGDELPGQAVIEAIHADRVILKRAGRLETLNLPKERTPATRTASTGTTRSTNTRGRLIDRRQDVRATTMLKEFRNTLNTDPADLTRLIQLTPYQENGQFAGFRIQRVTGKARQLLRLGLRRGDIVTAINGIALDSPVRGLEVMNNINNASELTVEVLRRGEALSFRFAL